MVPVMLEYWDSIQQQRVLKCDYRAVTEVERRCSNRHDEICVEKESGVVRQTGTL